MNITPPVRTVAMILNALTPDTQEVTAVDEIKTETTAFVEGVRERQRGVGLVSTSSRFAC